MNSISTLALLVFCAVPLTLMGQTQSQYLEEADRAFEEGNFAAAVEYYSNAYEFDTSDIDLAYRFAESARMFDAYTLADSLYEFVINNESDGGYPEATFWRGILQQRLGNYQPSSELFSLYLSENEGENEYLTKRANKEIEANQWALDYLENMPEDPYFEKISEEINTPYSEFGAYSQGDTLYYSSLRFENEEDDYYPPRPISKILISENTKDGGIPIEDLNKEEMHTAHTTFSIARDRIYYTICAYEEGHNIRCDLYYRGIEEDGSFGAEVKVPEPVNTDSTTTTEPSVGRHPITKEEVVYFVSDRPGGKGKRDIWYVAVEDEKFGEPENLESLNTAEDDLSPQYHLKTNTLYFSSEGYLGFGGLDVYSSRPDRLGNWSKPENIGAPINSSYHDVYFQMLDGPEEEAFLSSNRKGSLYLVEGQEACCFDLYKTRIPDMKGDLIVQTFKAGTSDSLRGVEVTLRNASNPAYSKTRQHPDSASYRFPLKYNRDYEIIASHPGYLTDTISFNTRSLGDTSDIVKKLFLNTVELDLLTLVYDGQDSLPIRGAEVTVIPLDDEGETQKITNLDGNDFRFPLDRDKRYRVIASRKGYKSQSIVLEAGDFGNENEVVKRLYLPIGDLDDFLPLVLYFDNDHPDPKTWRRTTQTMYSETFAPYYSKLDLFQQEFTAPLTEEEELQEAEREIERFFETELKKGGTDLERFLGVLTKTLEKGIPVNIFIKGYTSPRYIESYNYALGLRRVASVKNELRKFKDGELVPYMNSGQLNVREKSFGELDAPSHVPEDLEDERNSIFSVDASKERRVEIINVDKE